MKAGQASGGGMGGTRHPGQQRYENSGETSNQGPEFISQAYNCQ